MCKKNTVVVVASVDIAVQLTRKYDHMKYLTALVHSSSMMGLGKWRLGVSWVSANIICRATECGAACFLHGDPTHCASQNRFELVLLVESRMMLHQSMFAGNGEVGITQWKVRYQ